MISLWFPYSFLWFPYDFPIISLWFPYDFPQKKGFQFAPMTPKIPCTDERGGTQLQEDPRLDI